MSPGSPEPSASDATATSHPTASAGSPTGHAAALYAHISADASLTQSLFRQALQDPGGALERIVALGQELGLPVSRAEVKAHVASLDDAASKQWLLKARGGL
ncbi:MAG: hypothetical protein AAFX65_08110 [Cyanobacteria bacterium J06638_7]